MLQASDSEASWVTPFGGLPGELRIKPLGIPSHPVWEHPGILQVELTGMMDDTSTTRTTTTKTSPTVQGVSCLPQSKFLASFLVMSREIT